MAELLRIKKMVEALSEEHIEVDGERLYDNQELCELLHVSKRTLQRYRASGLRHERIRHKTVYRRRHIEAFLRSHFKDETIRFDPPENEE